MQYNKRYKGRVIRFVSFSRVKLHFPLLSVVPFSSFPVRETVASTGAQSVQRSAQPVRKPIVLGE